MPKHIRQQAGSEALHTATGRTHDEWHEVLVAAGASGWKHKQIAEHLVAEHGVDGWWAQGITVDFEQRVQGRQPGQRSDGTFELGCAPHDCRRAGWLRSSSWPHRLQSATRRARRPGA